MTGNAKDVPPEQAPEPSPPGGDFTDEITEKLVLAELERQEQQYAAFNESIKKKAIAVIVFHSAVLTYGSHYQHVSQNTDLRFLLTSVVALILWVMAVVCLSSLILPKTIPIGPDPKDLMSYYCSRQSSEFLHDQLLYLRNRIYPLKAENRDFGLRLKCGFWLTLLGFVANLLRFDWI